jgi:cytochrome c-type biogenesis protein CcmH
MTLSVSSLLIMFIATAMAALALTLVLPRLFARGRQPATKVPSQWGRTGVALVAAAIGVSVMVLGLQAYVVDTGTTATAAPTIDAGVGPTARDELARHLERSPRDGRAWVFLARLDFEAERYADAAAAYGRALAASPKVALDSGVWCEYADALGMAQGGTLAGRPREVVLHALAQNPAHPKALEMAGSAAFEAGEYASAAAYWRQLMAQIAEGVPARVELAAAIARADERALVIVTQPRTK